jgi:ribosome-binding factor A
MSRRTERVSEAVREVVSSAILFEVKDPRVQGITVTRAQVTGDLRHAKVFVSIMGDAKQQRLAERGLNSARGFLQRKVAQRLDTRYTPVIEIVVDDSVKKSLEMSRLLREALPEDASPELSDEDVADNDSEDDGES